jgi:acyl-coenzyme A thioesterase PaaI-like protein
MATIKRKIRTAGGMKEYTYLGCPLTRNRTPWCFRLCTPAPDGSGKCGRVAPHSFKSRIQKGIADHKQQVQTDHYSKLERMYVAARCNEYYEPGIKVWEGSAEIVIPVQDRFFHAAGTVHGSVYFKALDDAAFFAVNSLVEKFFVLTVGFNSQFTRRISSGVLVARGRYIGRSGGNHVAESVLTDYEGNEIGRGSGTFAESRIRLTPKIGYR